MNDPLAYFLTWVTYGTWLPGDERGWVEYHHGWQLPDPIKVLEAKAKMTEDACVLSLHLRDVVEKQIAETCGFRSWPLFAVNCRTNHLHCVVAAHDVHPTNIRIDLKAWTTRRLKKESDCGRVNWWAERGSIRFLNDEESLESAIRYVMDGQ